MLEIINQKAVIMAARFRLVKYLSMSSKKKYNKKEGHIKQKAKESHDEATITPKMHICVIHFPCTSKIYVWIFYKLK